VRFNDRMREVKSTLSSTQATPDRPDGPSRPNRSRGRGRPRADSNADTRGQIIAAARQRFADDGFDGTSLRAVASDAGVDASLIRHYFGDKSGLLVATMQLPVDLVHLLSSLLERGTDRLGERLVTAFLNAWDSHRDVFTGLIRTTVASADRSAPMLKVLRGVVLVTLANAIDGDQERELRASLLISQLIGMASLRYVLQIEPLAQASAAEVATWYGPVLQALITPGESELSEASRTMAP